jgi:alkanesulfonate monooxygenase SsuD/methylene tetrahydromethanopterin reductase-like flavin-dependent oxidoreductase (luciferase family)
MVEGQEGVTWEQWLALADACERAGLDGLFRSDHYLSIVRGGESGALDAWATLTALAARTTRIRLGTLVSPVTFRPASVLAKCAVTADHVSGGRIEVGMGAGWYEAEHEAYGFPFPSARERMGELEAQVEEIVRQWTDAPDIWPKPHQRPHPPLIVGGGARPRSVRLAARFAAEYNTTFASPETCRERREVLDAAARAVGRAPLRFSLMTSCAVGADEADLAERLERRRRVTGDPSPPQISGTVEQVAEVLRRYAAAGVERVMLQHLEHEDLAMVALLGSVAAAVG